MGKCEKDSLSTAGFDKMCEVISNARVVVIGEQNHGIGTDYENFAFLVKYLHEEKGFDVVLQEYSFFDFGQINKDVQNGESAQEYRQAMYWPQGKAKENDILFDYIDLQNRSNTPIYMEGFDSRFFQRDSFYYYFDSIINTNKYSDLIPKSKVPVFMETLSNLMKHEYRDTLSSNSQKKDFYSIIDFAVDKSKTANIKPRMKQLLKNIKSFAINAWNPNGYDISDPDRFAERREQMAENIIWLCEKIYPNKKIIIRMHNGHAAKNHSVLNRLLPDSLQSERKNTGTIIDEYFSDKAFFIGTTHYSGTYSKWDFKPIEIPKPDDFYIESELREKGLDYAFVDIRDKGDFYMYYNEFNTWIEGGIKAPYGKLFDALIFIDDVKMPTEKK
ncbi:MAG: hypothetical protein Kapaf2KO_01150 [Candidatus Kapaibacteriales bacterium]